MKNVMTLALWATVAGAIIYGVIVADHALLFQNPMMALSLGVVGLGLCMHARQARLRKPAQDAA